MSVPAVVKPPKLRANHEIFCMEFLKDLNGTQAAIRTGYSQKTAGAIASRLLKNVNISNRITTLKAERATRCQVESDEVLHNLVLVNKGNIDDYLDAGDQIDISKASRDQRFAISEFRTSTTTDQDGATRTESVVRLKDGLKAADMLAKHTGLYEADNQQKKAGPSMTEEEAQARILSVLQRMKSPPVDLEQAEDAEVVPSDARHED